jgi:hypothetical protein
MVAVEPRACIRRSGRRVSGSGCIEPIATARLETIMKRLSRRLTHVLFSVLLMLSLPAQAGEPGTFDAAEAKAVRAVIEAQLAAFAADDGQRALSYAFPDIRKRYPAPEGFLEMVRKHYPVVYRPRTVGFLEPELADDEVFQAVEMSDADGVLWIAIYRMGRIEDGNWRIMGCRIVPGGGSAI